MKVRQPYQGMMQRGVPEVKMSHASEQEHSRCAGQERTGELGSRFPTTSTEEIDSPVYPPARRKLAEHGIDCAGKTARQFTHSGMNGLLASAESEVKREW